jgi:hypothetical protein
MNFKKKILLLWVIFALLDPDPDPLTRLNPDPIRIRNPDSQGGKDVQLLRSAVQKGMTFVTHRTYRCLCCLYTLHDVAT